MNGYTKPSNTLRCVGGNMCAICRRQRTIFRRMRREKKIKEM